MNYSVVESNLCDWVSNIINRPVTLYNIDTDRPPKPFFEVLLKTVGETGKPYRTPFVNSEQKSEYFWDEDVIVEVHGVGTESRDLLKLIKDTLKTDSGRATLLSVTGLVFWDNVLDITNVSAEVDNTNEERWLYEIGCRIKQKIEIDEGYINKAIVNDTQISE